MLKLITVAAVILGSALWAFAAQATQPSTQPAVELSLDLGKNLSIKLALIPAGKFLMGSPESEKDRHKDELRHEVIISKPFFLGVTPITQAQWKAVMGKGPWEGQKFAQPNDNNAASSISWDDANEFCRKLSAKTGRAVRLPTEAEWEYACRAGTQTRFYYGDDPDYAKLSDYAWYDKNAWNAGKAYAHAVGQKKPNAWGLYDMSGNVNQWCSDWLGTYPAGSVKDPTGPATGTMRVFRGGSFIINAAYCRAACRNRNAPNRRIIDNGLRVVLVWRAGVDPR